MEDGGDVRHQNRNIIEEIYASRSRKEKERTLDRSQSNDLALLNKEKIADFKASHGLLIAFLILILWVMSTNDAIQATD